MNKKEIIFFLFFFILITTLFFYKTFLYGLIPFPGDLLISEYNPWRSYSYLGYVPGSFPNKAQYFDVIRQIYPWKNLSIDMIKSGVPPLWNPYNFSGAPLLANFQSAVFYPFNIFYFIFSKSTTWTILIILQPFFAGFFTYLFARKIGISEKGSFLSSIAYSFSLFMSVFLEYEIIGHTIFWLPFLLYLIETLLKKITFWKLILFTLSNTLLFLAGHLQIASFVIVFVFFYALFRIFSQSWVLSKKILYLINFSVFFILSLGISSAQLLPTFELINFSARVNQDYQFLLDKLLIQPYQLIVFLSPDFFGNPATRNYILSDSYPGNALYIGLIPFIFSFFSITLFKKNYFIKFFLISFLFLLVFILRFFLTELFYQLQIPFFSTGSPSNTIFLLSFSLVILSGFGFDLFLKKMEKTFYLLTGLFVFLFLSVWFFIMFFRLDVNARNFLYSTIILAIFIFSLFLYKVFKNKNILAILLIIVTIFDLFYFFQKFNPFVKKEFVFPQVDIFTYLQKNAGINRFWGYGNASIEANFSTKYSIFSPDGYDPLYPKRYGEFIYSSREGQILDEFTNQTRSDAVVAPGFGEEDLSSNEYRLKVLDILGVKYILDRAENASTEKTFTKDRFKLVYEKNGWKIFENLKASPRVFLASNYKAFRNNDEFKKTFFAKNFDFTKTILLEETIPNLRSQDSKETISELNLISYTPNKIIFKTETKNTSLFFLSDTYYPGWKAFVDEKETKIYRANYAFRAIVLPGGNHKVVFKYLPQSFYLGVKLSIISIIVLLAISFFQTKIKILK